MFGYLARLLPALPRIPAADAALIPHVLDGADPRHPAIGLMTLRQLAAALRPHIDEDGMHQFDGSRAVGTTAALVAANGDGLVSTINVLNVSGTAQVTIGFGGRPPVPGAAGCLTLPPGRGVAWPVPIGDVHAVADEEEVPLTITIRTRGDTNPAGA